jgi:hypothetical protein
LKTFYLNKFLGKKRTNSASCKGHSLKFTSSAAIGDFLPQLGYPDILTEDYVDPPSKSAGKPISTSAGNFAGQLTALALSLGFDDCLADWGTKCKKLGDLYLCDQREDPCLRCKRNGNCKRNDGCEQKKRNGSDWKEGKPKWRNCVPYYGWTVKQLFDASNEAIGSCGQCAPYTQPPHDNPQCLEGTFFPPFFREITISYSSTRKRWIFFENQHSLPSWRPQRWCYQTTSLLHET